MKIKLLYLFVFLTISLNAQKMDFVLNTSGLLDPRAYAKIDQIGNEVKQKLGVNIYLDIKGNNGIDLDLPIRERIKLMKVKEKELVKNLKKPYVILTVALDQQYSNILYSKDMAKIIDRDDILDGYVIPLLAAQDKNTLKSKVSAAVFNGYAQIGDSIAQSKNLKLVSSIGSEGKTAGTIWKVFVYTLVLIGIISYFVIIMREKKYKKEFTENEKRGK